MKKVKVLALVLACALMLSGIGYALWNDSIVLESKADTGNLNVDFVQACNSQGFPVLYRAEAEVDETTRMNDTKYLKTDPMDAPEDSFNDWNDAYLVNADKISFEVSDLYPKASYTLRFTVKNNGTVPATLTSLVPEFAAGSTDLYWQIQGLIALPANSTEVLAPGAEKEYCIPFNVPDWTGDQYENLECIINITMTWTQVDVATAA